MRASRRCSRPWYIGLVVMVALEMGGVALAKPDEGIKPEGGVVAPEDQSAKDSPRAALAQFLDLCRAGDYDQAARYLDLPTTETPRGPTLARHLKNVLDRYVWFDLDAISSLPGGNVQDGLPPTVEEVATIPGPGATREPVRLVRHVDGVARWTFSRATVKRVEGWYANLDGVWLDEYLPARLLQAGPRGILYWQWMALPIEDFVGTVEAIGLRSTRIRTLDRTLVSIPNGKLADMRLESFTARDRLRLACTIGVVYETSVAQMRDLLEGLERVLRAHPKIWPDAVIVRFASFGDSSLNIDVMAWFQTSDWNEFQLIRQDVLLQFMAAVEKAGSSFAFPTRTVHVVGERSARSA